MDDLFKLEVKGLVNWQSRLWVGRLPGHCVLMVLTLIIMILRDEWPSRMDRSRLVVR